MQTTYIISDSELSAVALASSTEETRYYMNGVYFEHYGESVGLIATDGHRLHSINTEEASAVCESFILATADVKKAVSMAKLAKKEAGKKFADLVRVHIVKDGVKLLVKIVSVSKEETIEHGSFNTVEVDGTFPDWRRVVPQIAADGATPFLAFNMEYAADFGHAAKFLGASYQHIKFTSNGPQMPILVDVLNRDRFKGVLMPVRG